MGNGFEAWMELSRKSWSSYTGGGMGSWGKPISLLKSRSVDSHSFGWGGYTGPPSLILVHRDGVPG